jgi:(E)-4-hydroxy-3-methylbut-2-enyl-diphosphate synthase
LKIKRKKTKEISVGDVRIGSCNPVTVQSMLKSRLTNLESVKKEIKSLEEHGCEIIRIAIPDKDSASILKKIISEKLVTKPVVADIHFDWRLAIDSLDAGAHCIRINPGNIGSFDRFEKVVSKAIEKKAAIRIGVNSGSIRKDILKRNNGNIQDSIVESVTESVEFLEKMSFFNFKVSAKASGVLDTIHVYQAISSKIDYPLHIGVTEAGPLFTGSIKSALGIGILLFDGIGDTLRVSLTDSSVNEVKTAFIILSSLNLRKYDRANIISCPTCSRTRVNLSEIVKKVELLTEPINKNLKIAVMGCIVNGPGEASEADIGIAYGIRKAAIFAGGKVIERVKTDDVLDHFKFELDKYCKNFQ